MSDQPGLKCLSSLLEAKALHAIIFAHAQQANPQEEMSFTDVFSDIFMHHPEGICLAKGVLKFDIETINEQPARILFLQKVGFDLDDLGSAGFTKLPEENIWLIEVSQKMIEEAIEEAISASERNLPKGVTIQHLLDVTGIGNVLA